MLGRARWIPRPASMPNRVVGERNRRTRGLDCSSRGRTSVPEFRRPRSLRPRRRSPGLPSAIGLLAENRTARRILRPLRAGTAGGRSRNHNRNSRVRHCRGRHVVRLLPDPRTKAAAASVPVESARCRSWRRGTHFGQCVRSRFRRDGCGDTGRRWRAEIPRRTGKRGRPWRTPGGRRPTARRTGGSCALGIRTLAEIRSRSGRGWPAMRPRAGPELPRPTSSRTDSTGRCDSSPPRADGGGWCESCVHGGAPGDCSDRYAGSPSG